MIIILISINSASTAAEQNTDWISHITPENNSTLSSNHAVITWQTSLPCSSIVTIREMESIIPTKTIPDLDLVTDHRVEVDLGCSRSYSYDILNYIESTNGTIFAGQSGRRLTTGECDPEILEPLNFTVNITDTKKEFPIPIRSLGKNAREVSLKVSNPNGDLKTSFNEAGEAGVDILLKPFETNSSAHLLVSPKNPRQGQYNITIDLINKTDSRVMDTATANITIDWDFTIFNIKPDNNTTLNSGRVVFTWKTGLPSSSSVTILKDGESTPITAMGSYGVTEHVVAVDLSCKSSYTYNITSNSPYKNVNVSGRRLHIGECGPVIVRPLEFEIDRDYNQSCPIEIENLGQKIYNVSLKIENPNSDLIMGFIETGTPDEIVSLQPSGRAVRNLMVHAQDANRTEYNVTVTLTDVDESEVIDRANATITVNDDLSFSIEEVNSDPLTLVKTIRIKNLGDTITDLSVSSNPQSQIYLHPGIDHGYLKRGESIDIFAVPIFTGDIESIEGNVTATAESKSESLRLSFRCEGDRRIIPATLKYPQLTIVKKDWYCTNKRDISIPFFLPPGFNAADVEKAEIQIDFSLPSPKSTYRNHSVRISLNEMVLEEWRDVIPEGAHFFILPASELNYADPITGRPGENRIILNTTHLNPAHYVVNERITIRLCLKQLQRRICASSREEAEEMLWKTPGIAPVSDNLYVRFINPPVPETRVQIDEPFIIKASVNGSRGGSIASQSDLNVSVEIEGESKLCILFDDGEDDDSQENDGIYTGSWTPTREGLIGMNVTAINCMASGSDESSVDVKNPPPPPRGFDLAVAEIKIVKSTEMREKLNVMANVSNIGINDSPQSSVKLSLNGTEYPAYPAQELEGLTPGESRSVNWNIDENKICGKNVTVCVVAQSEANVANDCLDSSICPNCGNATIVPPPNQTQGNITIDNFGEVIIDNSGEEVIDYPVPVRMPAAGAESLSFRDEQGRELYYWVEKGSLADSGIRVWISVPAIKHGENAISVRSGTGPSDHQRPEEVFLFFDDFESLDKSRWNYGSGPGGSVIPKDGKISVKKDSTSENQIAFLRSKDRFSSGKAVIFRADPGRGIMGAKEGLGYIDDDHNTDHNPMSGRSLSWIAGGEDLMYWSSNGTMTVQSNFEPGFRIFEIRRQNNGTVFVLDETEYPTGAVDSLEFEMPLEFGIQSDIIEGSSEMTLDWVAVRDFRYGDLPARYVDAKAA